jgi:hypothetical protein
MKQLIILMTFIFLSCSPKQDEIKNVEIMSYHYWPSDKKPYIKVFPLLYAEIDQNGNVLIEKQYAEIDQNGNVLIEERKQIFTYYKTKIETDYLKRLSNQTKNFDEQYFKLDTTKEISIDDSATIRIKIEYKNGKILSFYFTEIEKSKKYSASIILFNELIRKSKDKNYLTKISSEIQMKRKNYADFCFNKDTLAGAVPKPPNKDKIKFIKP